MKINAIVKEQCHLGPVSLIPKDIFYPVVLREYGGNYLKLSLVIVMEGASRKGKKHDRDRRDYKIGKVRNDWNRSYRLYNGGYNGIYGSFKERKYLEKTIDEMENGLLDFEQLREYEERIERVRNEIIAKTKKRISVLQRRSEELRDMSKVMLERAEELEKEAKKIASSISERN